MVEEQTLARIQCADGIHFSIAQGKIEHIQVLLHPLLVGGFGDHHHIRLDEEPQGGLSGCFAVMLADLHQHGVGKAALFALCKDSGEVTEVSIRYGALTFSFRQKSTK